MSINIGPASSDDMRPKIMVVGVGGAGGNAIANMIDSEIEGVDFIVANTDAQALATSPAEKRLQLGPDITGGLGAGARPEVGKAAAEETVEDIEDALDGVNMCFIAAGMGGGTGTGAAPVIAEAARRKGVLTVGVVTKPFLFEGTRRMRSAEAGIDELQKHVDTLIVIPNQNLFLVAKADTTFKEAFALADEVLQQGVRSITDLMVMPGLINLDFADVRSVMSEMGKAMMGTGTAEGDNRALEAAERAIANPLLDGVSMAGAKGVIISIIGGEDMKLLEVDEAANHIRELVDEDANIIWGSAFNPDLDGQIRVSVVATGIDEDGSARPAQPRNFSMAPQRAPQRPVLDLQESEPEEEPFELNEGLSAEPEPEPAPEPAYEPEPVAYQEPESAYEPEPAQAYDDSEDEEGPLMNPAGLSPAGGGNDYGDEDEYEEDDDVDGIVDPLAGMRNEETERFDRYDDEDGQVPPPAEDRGFAHGATENDGWTDDADGGAGAPLDLSDPADDGALELGSDHFAEQQRPLSEKPARKPLFTRGSDEDFGGDAGAGGMGSSGAAGGGAGGSGGGAGGGAPAGGGSAQGSTLFERMANLSRGSSASHDDDEDEDEDEAGSGGLNIPRFLGRQNNQ
ncbi:cell division protein FtsZ [Qipengyuania sp. 1NDH17]|uniref:Cell division protein FtsZ n=1 Tax=Qipengyuania polymorpha TaxID=2867234 RepID=A0ABS7J1K0_9SPHN|nr:cell division protein FtsZ [Qipengyuania polymorpha]MBX7457944.1 cell division protein FtsZ [Qipengyuania polymorpha]